MRIKKILFVIFLTLVQLAFGTTIDISGVPSNSALLPNDFEQPDSADL